MTDMTIQNFLIQARAAAILMVAAEISKHPDSCAIWLFGDICDCGREVAQ